MIYAVIDTNVLVSALISHNPNAATVQVLKYLFLGDIIPLYNAEIIDEYAEVLHRPKFRLSDEEISPLLELFSQLGINASAVPFTENMPDEDDRVFYEVALSKEDSFLVTGNLKHFPKTPKVITASQLLEILSTE